MLSNNLSSENSTKHAKNIIRILDVKKIIKMVKMLDKKGVDMLLDELKKTKLK